MFYLGIDGGGTKTTAALTNLEGTILRTAKHGSGNIALLDRGSIAHLIRDILEDLLEGIASEEIRYATFAFAGAGRPSEKNIVRAVIRGTGISDFTILTDAEILHYSIFGEKRGILLAAGTGSICLIRNKENHYQQIGGWGYLLGDEGSGFFIGNKAMKAALQDMGAGKKPSELTRELLSFYGIEKPENLVTITYSTFNPAKLIASSAKRVCAMAAKGEQVAVHIIDQAVEALLGLTMQAIRFYGDPNDEGYKIALSGSILKSSSIVRNRFEKKLLEKGLPIHFVAQHMEPAAAAVFHSIKKDQKQPSKNLITQLSKIRFP